ncbi:MAG: PQQ-binding-like beta-propeller repeat protein, partial [Clostridia bacterium]|nr:PQQ-binding-like beta-propeller repeat protein [Clostridia bacterium]
DEAKSNDELVEVIYATMDGHIYFLDLMTGKATRDRLNLHLPFKGAGSLDPRGYPILYLGAGDSYDRDSDFRPAKAMALNLLDCSVLYEFGKKPDDFAIRDWTAYDSSALVCAENDSLVYPGENGILYVMKLNTEYDKEAGTLSMNPSDMIKLRYSSEKNEKDGFAVGYEGSAAAYSHYVFLTENTGLMHCVDLNTMEVVWAQDISDDTNSSPVFVMEGEECYLYIGNTVDSTARDGKGVTSFYKIRAKTGEIEWQLDREIYTDGHITGGVMTSAVIGKNNAEGKAFIVFSSYSDYAGANGTLVCVNTDDGSVLWEGPLSTYAWSSPAPVYDTEGNLYLVQCNCGGNVYLIDGQSDTYDAAIIDKLVIEPHTNIEATPAVYNDMIVIGTRVSGIFGIRIGTK